MIAMMIMMTMQRGIGIILLAAAFTVAPAPARAQANFNLLDNQRPKDQATLDREAQQDEAYRKATKKIPVQQPPTDPWGSIRTPEPVKPAVTAKQKKN
jgi:nitrate reductase cytochrome c-type subunit